MDCDWNELRKIELDARNGLPEELFLFISGIMPIPNVDLLIVNERDELLLTWRDDTYFGKGWHLPGGCIRYGETMLERVHKTAQKELGIDVVPEDEPLLIRDVIVGERPWLQHKNERGHHIAVLYKCRLQKGCAIDNKNVKMGEEGYMKWFSKIPDDILKVHDVYNQILDHWK
ncbi:MAG: NUDIX domain-containing protein [Roseburia inulinivorans]